MASITISDTSPRVQYTASSSQTAFTVPFEFFNATDIKVIRTVGTTDTTLTYAASPSSATQYSVSGAGETGGGSITLGGGATAGHKYTIYRDLPIARSSDFPASGQFSVETLNTELDKVVAMMQQVERDLKFSPKASATTSNTFDITFPNLVADKILSVNSSGNGLEFSQSVTNVNTVAGIASDITALSAIASDISAVEDIKANVTTVAGISGNVTTVAGISSNVTTVAGMNSNISSVVSNATNINTVAGAISNVNTVAGISSDVSTVAGKASLITADFVADLNTLATADIVSDLNTLATSDIVSDLNTLAVSGVVDDLETVADNVSNVNSVGGAISNVNTVAGAVSNINTVASANSNITTVAGANANISTVAGAISNINTVAGNNSNISTVAGANSNISTVASNITGVNSFADRYRVDSSDPSSSLNAGDLAFNTTSNTLKYYDGSGWQTITADTDVKTKVSSNDTTAGFLNGKLVAGTNVTFTEGSDGGNETLTIAATVTDNSIPFAIALG